MRLPLMVAFLSVRMFVPRLLIKVSCLIMVIGEEVRVKAIENERLPEDGFLYFRFVSTEAGLLTTSFIQNGSGSTTDVEDLTIQSTHQLFIAPDGRMYLYVDGKRYNILGQVVD